MASSTSETLQNIKVHKVPNFDVWEDQYGQTNGIGTDDIVVIPPAQLDNHMRTLVPAPGTANPEMDGTASPGASSTKTFSKSDHVHPTDTSRAPNNHASSATTYGVGDSSNYGHLKLSDSTSSTNGTSNGTAATPSAVKAAYDLANGKQAKITANGMLKGDGNGGVTAAVAGTDYLAPGSGGNIPFYEEIQQQILEFEVDFKEAADGQHIFKDTTNTQTIETVRLAKGTLNSKEGLALIKVDITETNTNSYYKSFWSEDYGKTWTLKGTNILRNSQKLYSFEQINGIWFLIYGSNEYDTYIYYSADLVTWTQLTLPNWGYTFKGVTSIIYFNGYYYFRFVGIDSSYDEVGIRVYRINSISNTPTWGSTLVNYGSGAYSDIFTQYGDYIFFTVDNYNKLYYSHKDDTTFWDNTRYISFSEITMGTRGFTSASRYSKQNQAFIDGNYFFIFYRSGLNVLKILNNNGTFSGNAIINIIGNSAVPYYPIYYNGYVYGNDFNKGIVKLELNSSTTTYPEGSQITPTSNDYFPVIINNHLCYLHAITAGPTFVGYTANEYIDVSQLQDSNGTPLILGNEIITSYPLGYVATGNYTGNGAYGSTTPSSLQFDFSPVLIVISPTNSGFNLSSTTTGSTVSNLTITTVPNILLWTKGMTSAINGAVTCSGDSQLFTWYSGTSAALQFNTNNTSYSYIAIGTKY